MGQLCLFISYTNKVCLEPEDIQSQGAIWWNARLLFGTGSGPFLWLQI